MDSTGGQPDREKWESVIRESVGDPKSLTGIILVGDRTRALAVDFDNRDLNPCMEFLMAAKHYRIPAYIERSKSKGYHAWIFFAAPVPARKARLVIKKILEEIGQPNTEVFPKQDVLEDGMYGNFINAPLFGRLVPKGRTVFLDPGNGMKPFPNQWNFLENIQRVSEQTLDEIIEINDWSRGHELKPVSNISAGRLSRTFGVPPCARRMLEEGVTKYQCVACFRLAVAMKRSGIPLDAAIAALNVWSLKNRPKDGKGIITRKETMEQTASAYKKPYSSCGCNHPAVRPYCDPDCPMRRGVGLGSFVRER